MRLNVNERLQQEVGLSNFLFIVLVLGPCLKVNSGGFFSVVLLVPHPDTLQISLEERQIKNELKRPSRLSWKILINGACTTALSNG